MSVFNGSWKNQIPLLFQPQIGVLQWPLGVVPLEKALCLHCLSLTPTSWNWEPAYAGSKSVIDWYPTQGKSVTVICLAPWTPGIRTDLMRLHGSEKKSFPLYKTYSNRLILDFIFFIDALRRKEKARTKEKRSRKEQRKEKDWRHPTKWRNREWNQ